MYYKKKVNIKSIVAIVIAAAALVIVSFFVFQIRQSALVTGSNTNPAVHDEVDANGVRPDVKREIEKLYPTPGPERNAATQLARALQRAIAAPEEALLINEEFEAATACLLAVDKQTDTRHDSPPDDSVSRSIRIESFVINSKERARAYIRYNANLSGQLFPGIAPDQSRCDNEPMPTKEE